MPTQDRVFYLVPHSHIDVEWYWSVDTTREWVLDIMHKALALMRQDPHSRFTQDQVFLLKVFWEALNEEDRTLLGQLVREGRWAIVGGTYVQPEVAEPNGESLIRQIVLGQEWLTATFGVRCRCGWLIDTFGQIPQIPQILHGAGYEYHVFWRDIPPEVGFAAMPADFYWESPDGSRILAHWMPGGYGNCRRQIRMTLDQSRTRHVFLPFGGDVARPTKDSLAACEETVGLLREFGLEKAEVRMATAIEYMDAVAAESEIPTLSYDFNPPLLAHDLRGTYDTRIELKKLNRDVEAALLNAEVAASLAVARGQPYPSDVLATLWEKLLFTHFHDIIGGSHHDPVYIAAMDRLETVLDQAQRLTVESLQQTVPEGGEAGEWMAVFNTLSYSRTELCQARVPEPSSASANGWALQDASGRATPVRLTGIRAIPDGQKEVEIEFVAGEVPPTGFNAYRLIPGASGDALPPGRLMGADRLENGHFRVEWSPTTGDLISIWDKATRREVLAGPGNVMVAAREKDPDMEGNIYLTGEEVRSGDYRVTSIETDHDALALRVRMKSEFQDCSLIREVVLYDFAPRIDFATTLENFAGGDVMVKVSFPLKIDWARAERHYETPFAATPRPDGHFAAQTWVDCSDGECGVALLNRGTPGYWIEDNRLELVLLRSLADYTAYQEWGMARGLPEYKASTQTELAREHGTHQFAYSLYPHAGTWREGDLSRLGQSFNTPLVTLSGLGPAARNDGGRSFICFEPDFIMTALKQAQSCEGLVVRGFETRGQAHTVTINVPSWAREVRHASLVEEPGELLTVTEGTAVFSCRPHEIVTLLLIP